MSITEARLGRLADAIVAAAEAGGRRPNATSPVSAIIESALLQGEALRAEDLPGDVGAARISIAGYVESNPEWALELSALGDAVHWKRADAVRGAQTLLNHFDGDRAVRHLADILAAEIEGLDVEDLDVVAAMLHLGSLGTLPPTIVTVATTEHPTVDDLRFASALALNTVVDAKVVLLLAPELEEGFVAREVRPLQPLLPCSVILITSRDLMSMARAKLDPRRRLLQQIVEQSDLTKVSPFVLHGGTPARMFYGREQEEATLVSALSSNSVALVGGRRIGKTSLMTHGRRRLEEAGYKTFYGDCQTVRTWEDFRDLAVRRWDVDLPSAFRPQHLFDMVRQLSSAPGEGAVVIMLDEIDHLLAWDESAERADLPEGFFRACRTLSQEGEAQFVFSGERTVARKLWDAQSPHWNFCQALLVKQLTYASAAELLTRPLDDMQIRFQDEEAAIEEMWEATSGHPQLVQYLGDQVVRGLNNLEPQQRTSIDRGAVSEVASGFSYLEHYLETYWGQASAIERMVSILVADGASTIRGLADAFQRVDLEVPLEDLRWAVRFLDLYGLLEARGDAYMVRLEHFETALEAFGGPEQAMASLSTRLR